MSALDKAYEERDKRDARAIHEGAVAFWTAIMTNLIALGAKVEGDPSKGLDTRLLMNGHWLGGYGSLALKPMHSAGSFYRGGSFLGTFSVTLHRYSGRHSNNASWRSTKDGKFSAEKLQAIAQETFDHYRNLDQIEEERKVRSAREDALKVSSDYQGLEKLATSLGLYLDTKGGTVTLKLHDLTVDQAKTVLLALKGVTPASEILNTEDES